MKKIDETGKHQVDSRFQIKVGSILSYVFVLVQILSSLLFVPWLSRYLGTSGYGVYTLGMSLINLFAVDFGLSASASKYLSKFQADHDLESENGFLGILFKFYACLDLVVLLVALTCFFFLSSIYTKLTPEEIDLFKPVYLTVCVYCVVNLPMVSVNAVFQSREEFVSLKLISLFDRVGSIVFMAIAIALSCSLEMIVILKVSASLVCDLVKLIYLRKKCCVKVNFKYKNKVLLRSFLFLSFWFSLSIVAQLLTRNLVPSILGRVANTLEISIYGYAVTISQYIELFSNVLAGFFLPKITRLANENKYNPQLFDLFVKVGKCQLSLLGIMIIGFAFLGSFFVNRLMGPDYSNSYLCVLLLVIPLVLQMPKTPMESYSYVLETVKYSGVIQLILAVPTFFFIVYLGVIKGAIGACIAYAVGISITRLLVDFYVYGYKAKVSMFSFFKKVYLPYFSVLILSAGLCLLLYYFWPVSSWIVFCVQALILIVFYCLSLFFCYYSKDERRNIFHFLFSHKKERQNNQNVSK